MQQLRVYKPVICRTDNHKKNREYFHDDRVSQKLRIRSSLQS